jgi:DNA repair exonuclease SbcCD ATPase subunit
MTVEAETEHIPLDQLAKIYRKIKTRMDIVQKEFDTQLETLAAQLDEVKTEIKEQMKAQGAKSVKTDFGTLSLVTKTRYSTNDWDSFKTFVVQNDVVDLLEKRIAQLNMSKFLEENPGLVPPGLNSNTEFEIKLYKAS